MAKSFEYDRFDVYGPGRIDPQGDGDWIKAQDAIDREKVNADRIRTLELQLKESRKVALSQAADMVQNLPRHFRTGDCAESIRQMYDPI